VLFDEKDVELGRNFCNKLWNACRFRLMQGAIDPAADPSKHELSIFARDLLAKLDATILRVTEGYEAFRFSDIAQALYDFTWGDFCDRFIEAAKADFDSPRSAGTLAVMDFTIQRILKLLHPYTPFITEELWNGLGFGQQSLMETPWPSAGNAAPDPRADAVYSAVSQARNLRATYNIPSNKRLPWQFTPAAEWVPDALPTLSLFLHAESLGLCDKAPAGFAACPTNIGILYLPLEGVVDASAERQRLQCEIQKVEAEIGKVAGKLSSETFVKNAPPAVVAEHRQRQQDWKLRLAELQTALRALG
jgi:valyl-tRNA synthetase